MDLGGDGLRQKVLEGIYMGLMLIQSIVQYHVLLYR